MHQICHPPHHHLDVQILQKHTKPQIKNTKNTKNTRNTKKATHVITFHDPAISLPLTNHLQQQQQDRNSHKARKNVSPSRVLMKNVSDLQRAVDYIERQLVGWLGRLRVVARYYFDRRRLFR